MKPLPSDRPKHPRLSRLPVAVDINIVVAVPMAGRAPTPAPVPSEPREPCAEEDTLPRGVVTAPPTPPSPPPPLTTRLPRLPDDPAVLARAPARAVLTRRWDPPPPPPPPLPPPPIRPRLRADLRSEPSSMMVSGGGCSPRAGLKLRRVSSDTVWYRIDDDDEDEDSRAAPTPPPSLGTARGCHGGVGRSGIAVDGRGL